MRWIPLIVLALLLSSCGSVTHYKGTVTNFWNACDYRCTTNTDYFTIGSDGGKQHMLTTEPGSIPHIGECVEFDEAAEGAYNIHQSTGC